MNKYVYKYYRLSHDDGKDNESNSITNQRCVIENYLLTTPELLEIPQIELADDGYSGTSFNRPGVKHLLDAAYRGEVACVIVKDLSRFGRRYLKVSKYLEQLFPLHGVRFIAVCDRYDSDNHKGTTAGLEIPVKNLFNALYSLTASKKVKSAKRAQLLQGKITNAFAPYGYIKDPWNKHKLCIDSQAATTVRRIYELKCAGNTVWQIAGILNDEGIPTPAVHKKNNGSKLKTAHTSGGRWTYAVIIKILRDERYTGVHIGGKTEMGRLGSNKKTYKSKAEWIRHENALPALITKDMWDIVISQHQQESLGR